MIKRVVTTYDELTKWDDFVLTAIAEYLVSNNADSYDSTIYFMGCLKNGKIINVEIENAQKYSNLLGHFIELYKGNS
ncbi:MAG TPA: hypothetical protein VKG26_14120 [Bacteroidia bacterium]|nr:hypothetical protein [Bacteroidia bacterium]